MDPGHWLAFAAASTALLFIPGPTVFLVLSYALSQGRRVALATVAGVCFGDLVAMSASLAGLGALVLASAALFTVLKWIGGLYLIFLGIRLIRGAGSAQAGDVLAPARAAPRQVFLHATAVTALNPKSIVFFIAFVPQFVAPDRALMPQFAVLIATFIALSGINVLIYALLADRLRSRISRPAVLARLSRLGGSVLVAMGLATLLVRRNPA